MATIPDMFSKTSPRAVAAGAARTDMLEAAGGDGEAPFADMLSQAVDERGSRRRSGATRPDPLRRPGDDIDRQRPSRRSRERDTGSEQVAPQSAAASAQESDASQDGDANFVPLAPAPVVPLVADGSVAVTSQTSAPQLALWQVSDTPARTPGARVASTPNQTQTQVPSLAATGAGIDSAMMTGSNMTGQQSGSAFDLLTAQEMMDPRNIQIETEGGELFERLQQAVTTGSTVLADDVAEVVLPQVVRNMAALARNGVTEMRLQLQPGDLGDIELRVRAIAGVVRGEVIVQHPEIKQLLDAQMERLRAALSEQGFMLADFDVGVADQSSAQQHGGDQGKNPDNGAGNSPVDSVGATSLVDAAYTDQPLNAMAPPRPVRLDPDTIDWLV